MKRASSVTLSSGVLQWLRTFIVQFDHHTFLKHTMKHGLDSAQQMHLDRQRLHQGQHLHALTDDDTNAGHLGEDQKVAVQAATALRRYLDSSN
jgi:hypothetical protein